MTFSLACTHSFAPKAIIVRTGASYRPGEVERQTQPGVLLLDAERVGAQDRCDDSAE